METTTRATFEISFEHPYYSKNGGALKYAYSVNGNKEAYLALNPESAIDEKTGTPLFMTSKPLGLKNQLIAGKESGVFINDLELEGIQGLIKAYDKDEFMKEAFVKEAKDLVMRRIKEMNLFWVRKQKTGSTPVQSSTPATSQEKDEDLGSI